jgi:hypothetical protein
MTNKNQQTSDGILELFAGAIITIFLAWAILATLTIVMNYGGVAVFILTVVGICSILLVLIILGYAARFANMLQVLLFYSIAISFTKLAIKWNLSFWVSLAIAGIIVGLMYWLSRLDYKRFHKRRGNGSPER